MNKKNLTFIALFLVFGVFTSQINFAAILGAEGQHFTLFQFFAPIAGAFLGFIGIGLVLLTELINHTVMGKEFILLNIIRLFPLLFATYYFSKVRKAWFGVAVPVAAMILFWLHPTGQAAWPYALLWLVPIVAVFFPSVLARSFGATFTAHAVGSVTWLYTVPMEAGVWIGLIPTVLYERTLFALGIAGSYWIMNVMLHYVNERWDVPILQLGKLPLWVKNLVIR
ncbi:MAG: hypothetical protein ABIH34_00495 [Nanoarchaeota archaeon]